MNAKAAPTVLVGQVWIDNDKRAGNRALRVDRIEGDRALCAIGFLRVGSGVFVAGSRKTSVALSRFRPISTGYRLHTGEVAP